LEEGWSPEREEGKAKKRFTSSNHCRDVFWSKVDIKEYFKIIPYFDPNLCMAESDTFIAKI